VDFSFPTAASGENVTIRIYMMDNRWNKNESELFGQEQRQWFEKKLEEAENELGVDFHIVVSGLLYSAESDEASPEDAMSDVDESETWHESEKEWFDKTTASVRNKTIILSGDVDQSSVRRRGDLFEFTTSPFTHTSRQVLADGAEDDANTKNQAIDKISKSNFLILDLDKQKWESSFVSTEGQLAHKGRYDYLSHAFNAAITDNDGKKEWWESPVFFWLVVVVGTLIVVGCILCCICRFCLKVTTCGICG
jgi:hypothetical protein